MDDSSILTSFETLISELQGIAGLDQLQEAISDLKEINTLLTQLSKTGSHLSNRSLEQIKDESFDVSGKYGKKAASYLSDVQEASNAGYQNVSDIAALSAAVQSAGDMSAELANEFIYTTDQAYELGGSVEKLSDILDGSTSISMRHAVTLSELAEGMSAVSSHAASLGLNADETASILGTMIAVTHQGGSEMAEAFETILLYINQITDEEAGITTDGLARYEAACQALNVSLYETKNGANALRDPLDVIRDLAREYSNLNSLDTRKADLLSAVGDGTNAEGLQAILENYSLYEEMLQNYSQGAGSLDAVASKTADSWEGSLNRLSDTWTETIGNIADSDAIVTIINSLNSLLSAGNSLTGWLGSASTIGLGAGLLAGIKNVGRDKMFSLI